MIDIEELARLEKEKCLRRGPYDCKATFGVIGAVNLREWCGPCVTRALLAELAAAREVLAALVVDGICLVCDHDIGGMRDHAENCPLGNGALAKVLGRP